MFILLHNFLEKLFFYISKTVVNSKGQSIAEFAVITAMMSTFVATAAPKLSALMEEGNTQKSIQEIDKLLLQAKNFYETTSYMEGRGRLPGQDKFDLAVGGYTDTSEVYQDLEQYTSFTNGTIGSKWVSVFGNHDGSIFQDDQYTPDVNENGDISCNNCPANRQPGSVEWYHLFNKNILNSPFQDGHYIYIVIPGNGSGEDVVSPMIFIADAENPSQFYKFMHL
tara:strand:- start:5293 stop:5964 length:672 start_codon:yes stop_codon:yes gene_type:complete